MAYFMVVDTETTDKVARKTDQPEPWNSLVYDLGYIIADNSGNVVVKRSFVLTETFFNISLMQSAYYADKRPRYLNDASGNDSSAWRYVSTLAAYQTMRDDIKRYKVRNVWAYNCKFDIAALNSTVRTYSNGFTNFWFPYGVRVRDIWDYASCITSTKRYVKWAAAHSMFTASGNPKTSAECVFAYLTNNPTYIESHTALDDCLTELTILQAARKRHKKTRHSMGQGWRDCANTWHELNK